MISYRQTLKKYIKPYKGYIALSIVTNILAALLNLLAFSLIIPILKILFQMTEETEVAYTPLNSIAKSGLEGLFLKIETLLNNVNYYISEMISSLGTSKALVVLCLYLIVMTIIKVGVTYWSLWCLIPVRTGVVRDLPINLIVRSFLWMYVI